MTVTVRVARRLQSLDFRQFAMLESRSAPSQITIRLQLLALWPDLLLARKREAFDAQGTYFVENASVLNKM